MKVSDLIVRDGIILDLKAKNKEEAIIELAGFLEHLEEVIDFKQFLRDVFEREKLSTTGIGNSVAIPHARTDAVNDFVIVFGRSQAGVEFDSVDNKPVNLIFLMGTPKSKGVNSYLRILARFSRLLGKEEFRNSLMKAATPEEIMAPFRNIAT